MRCYRWAIVLVGCLEFLLTACGRTPPPSPDPTAVLAILRHYPTSTELYERTMPTERGVDTTYRFTHTAATTPEEVIAYYDPLLRALGFKVIPGQSVTADRLPSIYVWHHYSCPFHDIDLTPFPRVFVLTYTTGMCR